VLKNQGILTCWNMANGEKVYEERVPGVTSGFSASPVVADGKLYLSSEDGDVHVIRTGPKFEVLATNPMGQPLMATPAISGKLLIIRGARDLFAVGSVTPR
jgi:outer membrane protein assembly factor BamB